MKSKEIRCNLLEIKRKIEEQIERYEKICKKSSIKYELNELNKFLNNFYNDIPCDFIKIVDGKPKFKPNDEIKEIIRESVECEAKYEKLKNVEDLNFSGNFKEMGDIANKVLNSECISDNRGNLEGYYSDLGDICQEVADDFEEIEFDSFENVIELLRKIVDKISEIA